jgi:hypothetical protein
LKTSVSLIAFQTVFFAAYTNSRKFSRVLSLGPILLCF